MEGLPRQGAAEQESIRIVIPVQIGIQGIEKTSGFLLPQE
jgi:hypothetical protein